MTVIMSIGIADGLFVGHLQLRLFQFCSGGGVGSRSSRSAYGVVLLFQLLTFVRPYSEAVLVELGLELNAVFEALQHC